MANSLKKSITLFRNFRTIIEMRKMVHSTSMLNVAASQTDSLSKSSPKIEDIANSIAQLNLIEVAELTDILKKKLNLPDAPMMSFGAIPSAAAAKETEEETGSAVQTSFAVKLKSYDEKQKVALIKEIKNLIEGMNLVQAKKFVESAPVAVKSDIGKTEAEKLRDTLVKVGAEIEIV